MQGHVVWNLLRDYEMHILNRDATYVSTGWLFGLSLDNDGITDLSSSNASRISILCVLATLTVVRSLLLSSSLKLWC